MSGSYRRRVVVRGCPVVERVVIGAANVVLKSGSIRNVIRRTDRGCAWDASDDKGVVPDRNRRRQDGARRYREKAKEETHRRGHPAKETVARRDAQFWTTRSEISRNSSVEFLRRQLSHGYEWAVYCSAYNGAWRPRARSETSKHR